MQILKETTVWNTDYSVANHTYLLDNKNRLIAYARSDTGEIVVSKSGTIVLDKRYRTFKIVNHPGLAKLAKIEKPVGVRLFKVQSTKKSTMWKCQLPVTLVPVQASILEGNASMAKLLWKNYKIVVKKQQLSKPLTIALFTV